MSTYICTVCGYIYDEASDYPEYGREPGTSWNDLYHGWICPLCGVGKEFFQKQEDT